MKRCSWPPVLHPPFRCVHTFAQNILQFSGSVPASSPYSSMWIIYPSHFMWRVEAPAWVIVDALLSTNVNLNERSWSWEDTIPRTRSSARRWLKGSPASLMLANLWTNVWLRSHLCGISINRLEYSLWDVRRLVPATKKSACNEL